MHYAGSGPTGSFTRNCRRPRPPGSRRRPPRRVERRAWRQTGKSIGRWPGSILGHARPINEVGKNRLRESMINPLTFFPRKEFPMSEQATLDLDHPATLDEPTNGEAVVHAPE